VKRKPINIEAKTEPGKATEAEWVSVTSITREIVDGVLADIEFTKPIELGDVLEVHRRITTELAAKQNPARVEIYHRHRDVVITVRDPNKHDPILRRILEAK
jgi:hypothetical protein